LGWRSRWFGLGRSAWWCGVGVTGGDLDVAEVAALLTPHVYQVLVRLVQGCPGDVLTAARGSAPDPAELGRTTVNETETETGHG